MQGHQTESTGRVPWRLRAQEIGRRNPMTSGWLYRDIDIDLKPGDRVALVGPTGSGKSLVLRALALLEPIDQGEIRWNGMPIGDKEVPAFRSEVLYLQQRSPVIEGTVEENLRVPFSMQIREGRDLPREELGELLETLGRDPSFLESRTTNLSGGERQMVALLRALLVAPSVLLLDEPSAALDPQATESLELMVQSWQASAPSERGYIWVSHDPGQARRVGDRILHLREGRLEAQP